VIPWQTLGKARAPDGVELVLYHRNGEYSIRAGGHELMSSRAHGSEEAMATVACERALAASAAPRLLIGGLGLGYTVRAALDALPATAEVVVAEIVGAVIEWNRGPLAHLAGRPLDDPRTVVVEADVAALMGRPDARYDAILLDVDNGPANLTRGPNQALYAATGLATAKRALRRGGLLVVWSAAPDHRFEQRLRNAGFAAETMAVPARGAGGGPDHTLFIGRTA
jgi:spermidine synthase